VINLPETESAHSRVRLDQLLEWKMAFTRSLSLIGLAAILMAGTAHAQPQTTATHALLMDYDTGEALICKNCDQPMPHRR
jgi:D-alanyl-D-alanine carboxypeptidase